MNQYFHRLACVLLACFGYQAWGTELVIASQTIPIAEVCEAINARAIEDAGHSVRFTYFPAARSLQESNKGAADGEVCRIPGLTEKFPNLLPINPPHTPMQINVFAGNRSYKIDGWQSLAKYRVGIHAGHVYAQKSTQGFPQLLEIISDAQLLKMIGKNRIDLAPMIALDALVEKKKDGITQAEMLEPPLEVFTLQLYVHKNHEGLIPAIEKSMKKIVESGESRSIANKVLRKYGFQFNERGLLKSLD